MKEPRTHSFQRTLHFCLPVILTALAFLLTGCPQNEYEVRLKPQTDGMERTLVFDREDGRNTNTGQPNIIQFDADEYRSILTNYPASSLTNEGQKYVVRDLFTNSMPDDVGGAGAYTNLVTSLGSAGFYEERFRGNDDLAGTAERRFKSADQVANILLGWSRAELGREPGYENLRRFLDTNVRHDLKNISAYWQAAEVMDSYGTNVTWQFVVRYGQYLAERGYINEGDFIQLTCDRDAGSSGRVLLPHFQRLVARKLGVPDTDPLPASLAFLDNETNMEKSLDTYLAGTDLYRTKLQEWQTETNQSASSAKPKPVDVITDAMAGLIDFNLDSGSSDHLVVRLSLPSAPLKSNGRWDATNSEVVWDSDITGRTNATELPYSIYACWEQSDETFQEAHFGKVLPDVFDYCIWRSGRDAKHGAEWDTFVASLKPGPDLTNKIDAFRFSDEPGLAVTNGPSAYPRSLLESSLK